MTNHSIPNKSFRFLPITMYYLSALSDQLGVSQTSIAAEAIREKAERTGIPTIPESMLGLLEQVSHGLELSYADVIVLALRQFAQQQGIPLSPEPSSTNHT